MVAAVRPFERKKVRTERYVFHEGTFLLDHTEYLVLTHLALEAGVFVSSCVRMDL